MHNLIRVVFVVGKPSHLVCVDEIDWVPTLKMPPAPPNDCDQPEALNHADVSNCTAPSAPDDDLSGVFDPLANSSMAEEPLYPLQEESNLSMASSAPEQGNAIRTI